jgi:hypothetical protein
MEVCGQLHTPAALLPGKESTWYPLDRCLVGPQSRFRCRGEEINSQPLPGLELPIILPVAQCYTTGQFVWIELVSKIFFIELVMYRFKVCNVTVRGIRLLMYSCGPRFEYRQTGWISWMRAFIFFLSVSKQILKQFIEIGNDHFLTYNIPLKP